MTAGKPPSSLLDGVAERDQSLSGPDNERPLPDRLSLINRVRVPCGCIRAVDSVSGLAIIEKECGR